MPTAADRACLKFVRLEGFVATEKFWTAARVVPVIFGGRYLKQMINLC